MNPKGWKIVGAMATTLGGIAAWKLATNKSSRAVGGAAVVWGVLGVLRNL